MSLRKTDTRAPKGVDKTATEALTAALLDRMRERQKVLYAQRQHSLLIVLQGLDASGKDGTINNVFSGLNLLGCAVKAFKAPNEDELSHDFLWRIHPHAPARGMVQLFNRSHYEDVLVPRVEGWIDKAATQRRYDSINAFEQTLRDHGTVVLKFYLHISKEKQLERLQERINDPEKYWKHNDGDFATREKWDQYVDAYEAIFDHCGPWHIVPADHKWYRNYLIAKATVEALDALDLTYPVATLPATTDQ